MEKDFPELVKQHTEMIYINSKNIVVPVIKAKKKGCIKETLSKDNVFPFGILPFNLLFDFIGLARLFGARELEIHADIYFDQDSSKFFLDVPGQRINKYWTEVTEEAFNIALRVEDSIKIGEIHSHHNMAAIPSFQDNRSERVPGMLYIIVGRTSNYFPDIFIRRFISEEYGHQELNFEDFFESPFNSLPSFDLEKIEVTNG